MGNVHVLWFAVVSYLFSFYGDGEVKKLGHSFHDFWSLLQGSFDEFEDAGTYSWSEVQLYVPRATAKGKLF